MFLRNLECFGLESATKETTIESAARQGISCCVHDSYSLFRDDVDVVIVIHFLTLSYNVRTGNAMSLLQLIVSVLAANRPMAFQ